MAADQTGSRPSDGATKRDPTGSRWIACCGTWFSEDAWMPPQVDVERDPEQAARSHRVIPAGTLNCPECRRSLRRAESNLVETERVLAIADVDDAPTLEAAYAQRLRDTVEGTWLRFGPEDVLPGASAPIPVQIYEAVENVAFLSLPADVAPLVRVLDVRNARESLVDGPIPGDCFAVRIPADARRPIDRGGALARRTVFFPGGVPRVIVENRTDRVVQVLGALFAPSAPKLAVVDRPVSGEPRGGSCS